MFEYQSMFGYQSDNPAMAKAYDMMVLDQIEKDDKEIALRRLYGDPAEREEVD